MTFLGEHRPCAIAPGGCEKKRTPPVAAEFWKNQGVAVGPRPFDNLSVLAAVTTKNDFSKIKVLFDTVCFVSASLFPSIWHRFAKPLLNPCQLLGYDLVCGYEKFILEPTVLR